MCNKNDLKNATGNDTSNFTAKRDWLVFLKSVDKIDVDKLSDVVKNDVVKTTLYNDWLKTSMLFRLLILVI